jgi:hypothetical protein
MPIDSGGGGGQLQGLLHAGPHHLLEMLRTGRTGLDKGTVVSRLLIVHGGSFSRLVAYSSSAFLLPPTNNKRIRAKDGQEGCGAGRRKKEQGIVRTCNIVAAFTEHNQWPWPS